MRWQKIARAVVALIGVGCAVAVYVYLSPRPVPEARPAPVELGPDTVAISRNSTSTELHDADGKVIYQISSDVRRVMTGDRMEFEGHVRLAFARNGVAYTVTSDKAETSGVAGPTGEEQSQVVFRGQVRMNGEDGFRVETEEATYLNVEQKVTFPAAVAFTRDRLSGKGVGGELFMDRSVLWLHDQSEMRIAPEGGGEPVVVTGTRIGLSELDRYLRVEERARLTRDGQVLSADVMMVFLAEGFRAVSRIEMDGQSRVMQTAGGDRPDLQADSIDLDFAADTSSLAHAKLEGTATVTTPDDAGTTRVSGSAIDMTLAPDGTTLVRLDVSAPAEVHLPRSGTTPARTIRSAGLIAEGAAPAGLDRAVFSGGVDYREIAPASLGQAARSRVASSDSLVLGLRGDLSRVDLAEFRQNFRVTDDTMTARADEGRYNANKETLELRANVPARQRPNVVDQELEVTAQTIDIDLAQDAFVARGRVQSVRKPAPKAAGAANAGTGLFEEGKPIIGNADTLTYAKATGLAIYSGTVALLQNSEPGKESSVLRSEEARFDDKKKDLTASGKVRSTFFIEDAARDKGKAGGPTELSSDRMSYTERTRTAVYSGTAVMNSRNGERLTADQITLEMMPDRRALKTVVAVATPTTPLRATLPEGRQVTGLQLTYDATTEDYVVRGAPAMFISRSVTRPGICEVGTGTGLSFKRGQAWSTVTNEGGAVGSAKDVKCEEVIK